MQLRVFPSSSDSRSGSSRQAPALRAAAAIARFQEGKVLSGIISRKSLVMPGQKENAAGLIGMADRCGAFSAAGPGRPSATFGQLRHQETR